MVTVRAVYRVQNKQMEEMFALHLRHLAGDEMENLDKIKHERAWHGTSGVAFKIARTGFNRSTTIADARGKGIYLARYALLACHHAFNKGKRIGFVIACKIASTKIGRTSHDSTEPNAGCDIGGSGNDYNSWMRISFKDSQVCPEYILEVEQND